MTTVGTNELRAQFSIPENTIHRLIRRGIIQPTRAGGSGSRYEYDEAEQRAVAAVVCLMRSHLMAENKSPHAAELRDPCLRSVAEAARAPAPLSGRALADPARRRLLCPRGRLARRRDGRAPHPHPAQRMSDQPACAVVCLDCSPRHRWEQPFPTLEAADRWQQAHTARYGHERFDRVQQTNDEA